MDRATLQRYLTQADGHVTRAAVIVARQREIIVELKRMGLVADALQASVLLVTFEAMLAAHSRDRDRLVIAIANTDA
jgi:hypothetical protein